ncbi:MAG TPA: ABATE domain-containing protein [Terriglobales bacterium]|nr:ABATE domain-containing protein [Terriglobales bacterium]
MAVTVWKAAAPFEFVAGNLALDFVNTVGNRLGQPRDYFTSPGEGLRWARQAGLETPAAGAGDGDAALAALRRLREELYRLRAPLAGGAHAFTAAQLAGLNRRLGRLPPRRLAAGGGRVGWRWAGGTPWQRLQAALVLSAADLLASPDAAAIRQCQDDTCGWPFLDHSQAGRRRWCSMADCGNRAKARRHQQRLH